MKLKERLLNIWNYRKNKKREKTYDEILITLNKAVAKKRDGQYKLKAEIMKTMGKFLRFDANSKFIPHEHKSEFEIRTLIENKWGKRMAKLDIILTDKMYLEIR